MKNILLIQSTGLTGTNIKEIKKLYSSKCNILVAKDNYDSISKIIDKNKINALIGCPRFIFTESLLNNLKDLNWVHNSGAGVEGYFFDSFKNQKLYLQMVK